MASYATPEQLQEYVGESVSLPSLTEQTRLLQRASEYLDEVTLGHINADVADHVAAAQNATVAQVEYWLNADESVAVTGPIQGYQIGSIQVQYGAGSNRVSPGKLAPRARSFLFMAGLLYRGVGSR